MHEVGDVPTILMRMTRKPRGGHLRGAEFALGDGITRDLGIMWNVCVVVPVQRYLDSADDTIKPLCVIWPIRRSPCVRLASFLRVW